MFFSIHFESFWRQQSNRLRILGLETGVAWISGLALAVGCGAGSERKMSSAGKATTAVEAVVCKGQWIPTRFNFRSPQNIQNWLVNVTECVLINVNYTWCPPQAKSLSKESGRLRLWPICIATKLSTITAWRAFVTNGLKKISTITLDACILEVIASATQSAAAAFHNFFSATRHCWVRCANIKDGK